MNQTAAAISTSNALSATGMKRQPPGMAPSKNPLAGRVAISSVPTSLVTEGLTEVEAQYRPREDRREREPVKLRVAQAEFLADGDAEHPEHQPHGEH